MEPLDRQLQKRVWDRVYAQPPKPPLSPALRNQLQQCLQRNRSNLLVYEKNTEHSLYGPAFSHLAELTRQQNQMLQQILGK